MLTRNNISSRKCHSIFAEETKIARNRYLRKRTEAVKDKDY